MYGLSPLLSLAVFVNVLMTDEEKREGEGEGKCIGSCQ